VAPAPDLHQAKTRTAAPDLPSASTTKDGSDSAILAKRAKKLFCCRIFYHRKSNEFTGCKLHITVLLPLKQEIVMLKKVAKDGERGGMRRGGGGGGEYYHLSPLPSGGC